MERAKVLGVGGIGAGGVQYQNQTRTTREVNAAAEEEEEEEQEGTGKAVCGAAGKIGAAVLRDSAPHLLDV